MVHHVLTAPRNQFNHVAQHSSSCSQPKENNHGFNTRHTHIPHIYVFFRTQDYFTFSYTSSILPPRLKGVQCSTTECLPQRARRRQSRRSRGGSVHPNRRLKATNRWEESRGKHHQRTSTLFLTYTLLSDNFCCCRRCDKLDDCVCVHLPVHSMKHGYAECICAFAQV